MKMESRDGVIDRPLLRSAMPELDSLRGVAILLVIFLHGFAYVTHEGSFTGPARQFVAATSYGWIGVHLFFVLSGFLITGILLDNRWRPDYYSRFYIRRGLRILPAYYGLLTILAALNQTSWLGHHTVGIPFLLYSFTYLSNLTPLFGTPIQYAVLWSLAVEEHFYLVWPAVVRRLSRSGLTLVALGVFLCGPLIRAFSMRFGHAADAYFFTWCNSDGLALGALVAIALRRHTVSRRAWWGLSSCVALASGGTLVLAVKLNALSWSSVSGFALRLSFLNLTFAALLVLTLLLGTGTWSFLVNIRVLRFFGKISYGLYLVHMIFFYMYQNLAQRYWPSLAGSDGNFGCLVLQFLCAGLLSIVVAALSRRYFEEYFLKLRDRSTRETEESREGNLQLVRTCDFNPTAC